MQRWIPILSGLLVLQLALALVLNLAGEEYGAFRTEEKLIAFDKQAVDGLRIEDDTNGLVLKKHDDQWLLPESQDFPANPGSVDRLLDKLADLEKGWPVATTGGAARRFKVADEQFERKLTLLADQEVLAEFYIGTSPGFRKVHARPAGEDAVFSVAFNSWEASAEADAWIDKGVLTLDEADVQRVEIAGLVLQREDGKLKVLALAEEETTNEEAADSLVRNLAELRIQSLLGSEAKPEYRQDEPELEFKVAREGGDVLSYRFSKPEDASYYVLKRSDLDYYFKIAEFTVQAILDSTRDELVDAKTGAGSSDAAEDELADAATTETAE